jgi:hypothetical protein
MDSFPPLLLTEWLSLLAEPAAADDLNWLVGCAFGDCVVVVVVGCWRN